MLTWGSKISYLNYNVENVLLIGSILAIHILAWFTPGPQLVLIIRNAVIYSRRIGFFTAIGFALGNFIHIVLSVVGIGLIIAATPLAATLVKLLGVGYLTYLGIKTFLMKINTNTLNPHGKHTHIASLSAMKMGLVTNLLSPQAPLFFASIFGSLLASGAPMWVVIFLMIAMPLNTLLMTSLWSLFFTQQTVRRWYVKFEPVINKALGVALLILAITIALSKR